MEQNLGGQCWYPVEHRESKATVCERVTPEKADVAAHELHQVYLGTHEFECIRRGTVSTGKESLEMFVVGIAASTAAHVQSASCEQMEIASCAPHVLLNVAAGNARRWLEPVEWWLRQLTTRAASHARLYV